MKKTCESYFVIQSAGTLDYEKGFLPEENSAFPPDEMTEILGIQPFRTHVNPKNHCCLWCACLQSEPDVLRTEQPERIAETLFPLIEKLNGIKEKYHVFFRIEIYPYEEREDSYGTLWISPKVSDFCARTGTGIIVDIYYYEPKNDF